MDTQKISMYWAVGTLGTRLVATCLQSRFPDSRRIRLIHIPAMAMAALSYAVMGHDKGAALYGGAAVRSSVRATPFGARRKKLVGAFMSAAVAGYTALTYRSPSDLIPLASFVVGTAGDMSSQGRRLRALFFTAMATCGMPYACLKGNLGMAVTEGISALLIAKAAYRYDIKNAAGPEQRLWKNLSAYFHGVVHGSATGARPEAQVDTDDLNIKDPEHMVIIMERYKQNLQENPCPLLVPEPVNA